MVLRTLPPLLLLVVRDAAACGAADCECRCCTAGQCPDTSVYEFIAGSDSDDCSEETAPSSENDHDQELDVANIIATRQAGALRRSTRTSKAPVRYVDDDYIRLMTEDADAEDAVSSDDKSEECDDEEDEEYDNISESETSSEEYSSDESSELRVVRKKQRLDSAAE